MEADLKSAREMQFRITAHLLNEAHLN